MTDHTPTPRTDKEAMSLNNLVLMMPRPNHSVVYVHFARALERELAHYKRLEAILEDRSDVDDGYPNEANRILSEWRGPV